MFLPLGTPKDELDTPALLLDLDLFEANVAEAAALCRRHGVAWRPHAKCHKSPDIGRRLIEAGAIAWFYDGPGGSFDYWPDGPSGPMRTTADENTSMSISGEANTTAPILSVTVSPFRA